MKLLLPTGPNPLFLLLLYFLFLLPSSSSQSQSQPETEPFDEARYESFLTAGLSELLVARKSISNAPPSSERPFTEQRAIIAERINACFELIHYEHPDADGRLYLPSYNTDASYFQTEDIRGYALRCLRGIPFNERVVMEPTFTYEDYLNESVNYSRIIRASFVDEWASRADPSTGVPNIDSIDDRNLPPSYLTGRGNFRVCSISQLEQTTSQIEHLVRKSKLPPDFLSLSKTYREQLIPEIAAEVAPGCTYVDMNNNSEECGDITALRRSYYALSGRQQDMVHGTHGMLIYHPVQPPRSFLSPFVLNPDLDFEGISESYSKGEVVVIDNFLSENGLKMMRDYAVSTRLTR
jgi:hypothetical protein